VRERSLDAQLPRSVYVQQRSGVRELEGRVVHMTMCDPEGNAR